MADTIVIDGNVSTTMVTAASTDILWWFCANYTLYVPTIRAVLKLYWKKSEQEERYDKSTRSPAPPKIVSIASMHIKACSDMTRKAQSPAHRRIENSVQKKKLEIRR